MTAPRRTVLKHSALSYLIVAFLALCCTAVVHAPVLALVYLLPLGAALYVARTATVVDATGLHARALLGSRTLPWDQLAGLRLDRSGAVYAVDRAGGQLRLPCVRSTRLDALVAAGAGRIPDPAAA
ncbi:MAG: PH domain-containing protein [Actinobacteria bacterium]|nr:PH domain-containing protein [Actinomycetota bacterium]